MTGTARNFGLSKRLVEPTAISPATSLTLPRAQYVVATAADVSNPSAALLSHSPVAPAMAGGSAACPCLTDPTVRAVANFNSVAREPSDAADASTSPPALVSAATPSEPCALPPCSQALAAGAITADAPAVLSSIASTITDVIRKRSLPYAYPHKFEPDAKFMAALERALYVEFEGEWEIADLLGRDT